MVSCLIMITFDRSSGCWSNKLNFLKLFTLDPHWSNMCYYIWNGTKTCCQKVLTFYFDSLYTTIEMWLLFWKFVRIACQKVLPFSWNSLYLLGCWWLCLWWCIFLYFVQIWRPRSWCCIWWFLMEETYSLQLITTSACLNKIPRKERQGVTVLLLKDNRN